MEDYKKMYLTLFNKITDLIEQLKEIQREVEEAYIDSEPRKLVLIDGGRKKDDV